MTEQTPACFEHSFPEEYLDYDALKVIDRLERYGHVAYMVGGCVRDLLLGIRPKDYDLATSASPRQAKKLFRNSRIIGRRFRLVHVTFSGKTIELSTFRRAATEDEDFKDEDEDLLIKSDNVFGTPREDALRRDFTINALFYSPSRRMIIDYVGGIDDLRHRRLRTIGEAGIRFREDPVRIIRAIKLAIRLNLEIDESVNKAIVDYHKELMKSAPPRILEELYKILKSGAAGGVFRSFYETGVLETILPALHANIVDGLLEPELLFSFLDSLDRADEGERRLSNPVLLGGMLMALFDTPFAAHDDSSIDLPDPSEPSINAVIRACPALQSVARRERERLRQILLAQRRFFKNNRGARRTSPATLVKRPYFCEAYQLFAIAADATGRGEEDLERWKKRFETEPMPQPEEQGYRRKSSRKPTRRRPPRSHGPH